MTRRHFIALADVIRAFNGASLLDTFTPAMLAVLADYCESMNPRFNRARWLEYIARPTGGLGRAAGRARARRGRVEVRGV